MVSAVASQQKGPGFDSTMWLRVFSHAVTEVRLSGDSNSPFPLVPAGLIVYSVLVVFHYNEVPPYVQRVVIEIQQKVL